MSKGIELYSYLEHKLKELAIRVASEDSQVKYVAITGVFTSRYNEEAKVYVTTGSGVGQVKERQVVIPLPMLVDLGFQRYKALDEYNDFFMQREGFNGCFSRDGSKVATLKDVVQQGGFAMGYEGWSLKNLLQVSASKDLITNVRKVATQLKAVLNTSTLEDAHTIRMEAIPSPSLKRFYVAEDWTRNSPATFGHAEYMANEAHMTLCVFSKEAGTMVGTIEVPYDMAHEMSTDFNKPYMSEELQAYGAFMAKWLEISCGTMAFPTLAGGEFRFAGGAKPAPQVAENALVRLTQANTPTTRKRQERFIEMTKLLAAQGVSPKTSVNGQPLYEIALANNQVIIVGATFSILYKDGKNVGVLYNLEQTSIEQVIASVTLTNNPMLIWFVTSMDLRSGIKPCPIQRTGGRA